MSPLLRVALLTVLVAGPLPAQERTAPVVLRAPASAWALGLGNGFTAARGTSDLLFYNPSSLALGGGVAASVQRWEGASTAVSLSHALTATGWGIGVGARYLDYGAFEGVVPHPAELVGRGPRLGSSLAATVGVSRVIKGIRTGVAVSVVEERWPADREHLATVDAGLGRDVGRFSLGLAVRNIGPARTLDASGFETPLRVSLGALLRPRPIGVFFDAAAIAELAVDREGRVDGSAGGEVTWVPLDGWAIAARLGFRTVEEVGALGARPFTAGLGVSLDRFSLDYALDPQRGGKVAHRVGVRMR